jgi:hypothetical protein
MSSYVYRNLYRKYGSIHRSDFRTRNGTVFVTKNGNELSSDVRIPVDGHERGCSEENLPVAFWYANGDPSRVS